MCRRFHGFRHAGRDGGRDQGRVIVFGLKHLVQDMVMRIFIGRGLA